MIHPANAAHDHVTVSDLTVDCNYQPGTTITMHGINLVGSGNAIRRVKLLNCASFAGRYSEAFGLFIFARGATNNEISGCVVENYLCNSNNNLSALGIAGTSGARILNNTIKEVPGNPVFAFGFIGDHLICSGNRVEGCRYGFHDDTPGGCTNAVIINNQFINVAVAAFVANSFTWNLVFASNHISLNNTNASYLTQGLYFERSGHYTNLQVFGNTASLGSHTYTPGFFGGANITGLIIRDNRVAAGLTNHISNSTDVVVKDNWDLRGKPHPMNAAF
jgi:hypothetical protein